MIAYSKHLRKGSRSLVSAHPPFERGVGTRLLEAKFGQVTYYGKTIAIYQKDAKITHNKGTTTIASYNTRTYYLYMETAILDFRIQSECYDVKA